MTGFTFSHTVDSFVTQDGARIVFVPAGIQEKSELLSSIAFGLKFPAYSALNWDSLDECLADLSWITELTVVLRHSDLPLVGNFVELRKYLEVLDSALKEQGQNRLRVVFPDTCRARIETLQCGN